MNSDKDENDKSTFFVKKLKTNINKTLYQPERFNSAYKHRPFTTFKLKKYDSEKKVNYTKNNFYIPKLGRQFVSSKYSKNEIYQNKLSFIWGRNKFKNQNANNKYYAKEELVDKVLKLKKALNKLNNKNTEQKIKLNKQKKELKKQNEILNEVNKKYFFEQFFKNNNGDNELNLDNLDSGLGYLSNESKSKVSKSFPKNKTPEEIKSLPNSEQKLELKDNIATMSNSSLKELYKKAVLQNERKDQEILILKEQLEHNKLSNEALLSNMKMQYKKIMDDNNKKKEEIEKLKKNSKCSKYNEIMLEKEVYEKEMLNIKAKYNMAMEVQENYKMSLKKIQSLIEEINSKDLKIGHMENKLKLNNKNSEVLIENLKNELNKKEKKLKRLENDYKKLNVKINSSTDNYWRLKKERRNHKFVIESKHNFMIIRESKTNGENSNNIEGNNNIIQESNNVIENEKDKNQDTNYINHNLNFSSKENEFKTDGFLNRKNIKSDKTNDSLKIINIVKEQSIEDIINNEQNKEDSKLKIKSEEKNNQNMNDKFELLLIYIELTKRNINAISFVNEIFAKLNSENSNSDNKKIFFNYLINYFNITDEAGKTIVENLTNKVFEENKSLDNSKNYYTEIFNELSDKEKLENEEEFLKKISEIDENNLKNIIQKYDDLESGLVYFNQMISIIKEINMEEYINKILILTKDPEFFNLFNYQNLFSIIVGKNQNENSNKKESEIIMNNQEKEKEKSDEVNKINESSSSKKYEGEFESKSLDKKSKSNENNDDINKLDSSEKILKNLAHLIVIEGSTPKLYINSLLEEINEDNNTINVINPEKLFKFIDEKKIQINEIEKEEIIKKYRLENSKRNSEQFIDYDKFSDKLFEYMKLDDGISNDEDFMKNIKSMDIDGID